MNVLHRANTTGVTFLIICVHQIPVLKKSEKKKKRKEKLYDMAVEHFRTLFFSRCYITRKYKILHDQ